MRPIRLLRLVVLLLMALALPLHAAAPSAADPCPMGHEAPSDEAPADCCNDAGLRAATGQACKTGQDCPAGALPLLQPASGAHSPAAGQGPTLLHRAPPPTLARSEIWRPPAAS